MILLLDAHALLWWLAGDPRLAHQARAAIGDETNDVVVSAASVWELGIKQAKCKLKLSDDLLPNIGHAGFKTLSITLEDGHAAAGLPAHHRDPFDRMLIAQAMRIDAVIVSRDRAFAAYDVQQLLA